MAKHKDDLYRVLRGAALVASKLSPENKLLKRSVEDVILSSSTILDVLRSTSVLAKASAVHGNMRSGAPNQATDVASGPHALRREATHGQQNGRAEAPAGSLDDMVFDSSSGTPLSHEALSDIATSLSTTTRLSSAPSTSAASVYSASSSAGTSHASSQENVSSAALEFGKAARATSTGTAAHTFTKPAFTAAGLAGLSQHRANKSLSFPFHGPGTRQAMGMFHSRGLRTTASNATTPGDARASGSSETDENHRTRLFRTTTNRCSSNAATPPAAAAQSAPKSQSPGGAESVAPLPREAESKPAPAKARTPNVERRKFRERAVPSSRVGRAMGFAGLGAGMVWGAATEAVSRAWAPQGKEQQGNAFLSEGNAERLANALCRMRGAALKLGQMLSIQDEDMLPPQVTAALERVRQSADIMPRRQLESVLRSELGEQWHKKLANFEWEPAAAASIGQVHRANLLDGTQVALKIQYPGVANSIEADVDNLMRLMSMANVFPRGMYVEEAARVAKKELKLECDYGYEAACQQRFKQLMEREPEEFSRHFVVPGTVRDLCSRHVLCSEWVPGTAVDAVREMEPETRDRVGSLLLQLTLKELFEWRFMQTDPNWGNFLYDDATGRLSLVDFGAARNFPKHFVDDYLRMVMACSKQDFPEVINRSTRLGFLTGEESKIMLDAHCQAGAAVGAPFGCEGAYDFGSHNRLTRRVSELGATMLKHRLTAPPEDAYSLHRRLSGAFLVNIKLKAKVPCRQMFLDVYDRYVFDSS